MARHNWMSALPAATDLRNLIIPGTHDSAAWKSQKAGFGLVLTQNWDFRTQMDNGIRFFDLRLSEGLNFFHGKYYLQSNMGDFMHAAKSFLAANPLEAIFIQVKRENCDDNKKFDDNLRKVVSNDDRLFITDHIPLTMEDARGRITLLQRGEYIGKKNVLSYSDNTVFTRLVDNQHFAVQDCYCCGNMMETVDKRANRKVGWVQQMLDESKTKKDVWYLNFYSHQGLAAASIGDFAGRVASKINGYSYSNGCHGFMIMDFPDKFKIDSMINAN